ncbi:MAG TPA: sigma-70 family RNA polymerase sigma factor [Acidobacteriota bacterium]|nr:sigma-70 family RNA polymerase sigma factor [Acidobacteriota bacterium]
MKNALRRDATAKRMMYPEELTVDGNEHSLPVPARLKLVETKIDLDFDTLYKRYSPMVFGLALRILGDREEASDVSQEIFLTIYRKMHTFRGESSLKTWIYCIAANKAANRCRWWNRIRRRGSVSLEERLETGSNRELLCNMGAETKSPEAALLLKEENRKLEKLLLELPLQQRIAVVMRDVEGLSYEEIAESLEASLGTIKSRIARGRETLKRRFNRDASPQQNYRA